MVARRTVLSGAIAAGLAGSALAASGSAMPLGAPQSGSTRADPESVATKEMRQLAAELRDFRSSCQAFTCPWVDRLRQAQKVHFRANGKFPDFIDIGIDVWERVYDWHVRAAQPLTITRLADGRYAMAFMLTTLLLRADVSSDFTSVGYDAK
jgi:hypothetical protein